MQMKPVLVIGVWALLSSGVLAHPGSGIVVDPQGNVFVGDINRGLLKFTPDGKVEVVLREAGHFLAVDAARTFARMDFRESEHWPRWFKHRDPPRSELALISDGGSPLVIHRDGNLYYVTMTTNRSGWPASRPSFARRQTRARRTRAESARPGARRDQGTGVRPGRSLYAVTPGAVLKVKLDGTFTILRESVATPDCDRYLPPNTPPAHAPFLSGLTVSPRGDIYLAATGCRRVLKLDPNGRVSTVLKTETPWSPTGLVLHGDDLYVAEWTNAHSEQHDYRARVRKVGRDGKVTTIGTGPE